MKRAEIRSETEEHLSKIGFGRGSYVWQPALAQLIVVIGGNVETFTLKSGMSRRAFTYQMGFIAGLAKAAGVAPKARAKHIEAPVGSLELVPA